MIQVSRGPPPMWAAGSKHRHQRLYLLAAAHRRAVPVASVSHLGGAGPATPVSFSEARLSQADAPVHQFAAMRGSPLIRHAWPTPQSRPAMHKMAAASRITEAVRNGTDVAVLQAIRMPSRISGAFPAMWASDQGMHPVQRIKEVKGEPNKSSGETCLAGAPACPYALLLPF
ncbi:hypothetical protein NDU88_001300 [Pleurodeles waltl]|uniref:Uncharacterized protein n=1 Tax=Pleurodeles waltl TaxID=8319 RepID=A0AAV7SA22_PLEWA|nr:hypothetical protein NDU88_001300 [Pleurodeles waltl]